MNNCYNPVHIEFGEGSLEFLPRFINKRRALLVTSKGFEERGVIKHLSSKNDFVRIISDVTPNPTIQSIESVRNELDYRSFDVIVALGGGSVIDFAKALAPVGNNITIEYMVKNKVPMDIEVKPIIAVPTTAGTGSEVTKWGTVWDIENKLKFSISDERLYCEYAILDVDLCMTLPKEITIQTGLDALSHAFESIWNKNANEISELYAKKAIKMILINLPDLVKDLSNKKVRENMLLASYYSGLAFSSTQTAIAHAMSYYMTLEKAIPHGIAASFTLPIIIEEGMKNKVIANRLLDICGENLREVVVDLLENLGVSKNPSFYNLTIKDWEEISLRLYETPRSANSLLNSKVIIQRLVDNKN